MLVLWEDVSDLPKDSEAWRWAFGFGFLALSYSNQVSEQKPVRSTGAALKLKPTSWKFIKLSYERNFHISTRLESSDDFQQHTEGRIGSGSNTPQTQMAAPTAIS